MNSSSRTTNSNPSSTPAQATLLLSTKIPGIRHEMFHNYFAGLHLAVVTPRFNINRIDKSQLLRDFREQMSMEEKRLVFLTVLTSTGLLQCQVPPQPQDAVIDSLFPRLLLITNWIANIHLPNYELPIYKVTPETVAMGNLKYWIESLFQLKEQFYQERRQVEAVATLKRQEETLELLLRRADIMHQPYTPATAKMLATWALEISKAPSNMHTTWTVGASSKEHSGTIKEYWYWILTAPASSLYSIRAVDIQELIEHLEDNLDHGTTAAYSVLKYCRSLLERQSKGLGMLDMLGLTEESLDISVQMARMNLGTSPSANTSATNGSGAPNSSSNPSANIAANYQLLTVPAPEQAQEPASTPNNPFPAAPRKQDYGTLAQYLIAKMAWEKEVRKQLSGSSTSQASEQEVEK